MVGPINEDWERAVAIVAHPDDLEYGAASSVARWTSQGKDVSYVLPTAAGFHAWGRTWTEPGPWTMGVWYRPLAVLAMIGCGGLILVGMQPPNQQAAWIIGGVLVAMVVIWFGFERKRFAGPPRRAPNPPPAS